MLSEEKNPSEAQTQKKSKSLVESFLKESSESLE